MKYRKGICCPKSCYESCDANVCDECPAKMGLHPQVYRHITLDKIFVPKKVGVGET